MVTSENITKTIVFLLLGFLTSERACLSALAEAVSLHSEEAVLVVIEPGAQTPGQKTTDTDGKTLSCASIISILVEFPGMIDDRIAN